MSSSDHQGGTPRRAFLAQAAGLVLPASAMTVARPINPRPAEDTISVRDFGAKGDGVTDDAKAIQAAVSAAANKTLWFPASASPYRVMSLITIDRSILLAAEGASILFDFPPDTANVAGALLEIRSAGVEIRGLRFEGPQGGAALQNANRYVIRVDPRGATRYGAVRIDRCSFTNLTQHAGPIPATTTVVHAIYCRQADDLVVNDCVFDSLSGACVALFDTQRARVENNRCIKFGWSGIWLNNGNAHAIIRNNVFTGTTRENPSYWGGAIDVMGQTRDAALPGRPDENILIEGNRFVGGVYRYGQVVRLASTQGAVISGNTFYQCDADQNEQPGAGPAGCENNCITLSARDVTLNNGPHRNVTISDNVFVASGRGWQKAIFATTSAMTPANNDSASDGLIVSSNQFVCPDADNYFLTLLSLHGRKAGYKSIAFANNVGRAAPTAARNYMTGSVPGAVAIMAEPGHVVEGVTVTGNHLGYVGGAAATNNDCGVHLNPAVTRAIVENNVFSRFARATVIDPSTTTDVPVPGRNLFDPPQNAPAPIDYRGEAVAAGYDGAIGGADAFDAQSVASGSSITRNVRAVGAAMGDFAQAAFTADLQGMFVIAWVSARNRVSVRIQNASVSPIALPAGTIRVRVTKQ